MTWGLYAMTDGCDARVCSHILSLRKWRMVGLLKRDLYTESFFSLIKGAEAVALTVISLTKWHERIAKWDG